MWSWSNVCHLLKPENFIEFLQNLGIDESVQNLFNYISFRSALAIIISLFVSIYFGKSIILFLYSRSVKDNVRDLGLVGQVEKTGTPTMGGIIIIVGLLVPVLLLCRLNNIYVIIMLITTIWMGLIGFLDDYIKVFKNNYFLQNFCWFLGAKKSQKWFKN